MRSSRYLPVYMAVAAFAAYGCTEGTDLPTVPSSHPAFSASASSSDPWTLLADDFNAGSLDPLVWNVILPRFGSAVFVSGARVVIQNRGYLKTADTGIQCGATQASVTATNLAGRALRGTDAIETVGCE